MSSSKLALRLTAGGAAVFALAVTAAALHSGGCGGEDPAVPRYGMGGGKEGGPSGCADATSTLCGAACVDTATDRANCGSCGVQCGGGEACCARGCVQTASCAFSITSLEPARVMQNGGDWVTLKGQGFAKGLRVTIAGGRAPTRVIDATTARVLTPPGPPGVVDVSIALAGATATRKGTFRYDTAGVVPPWKSIPMATVRGENPGITVLPDGRALIAGGTTVPDDHKLSLTTVEIFERDSERMVPVPQTMGTKRWQNGAVTLMDGKVLLFGGACIMADPMACEGDPALAELFDPDAGAIAPTKGKLTKPRAYPRTVLLPDGRVFIASANDPSLDVYDPDAGTFTAVTNAELHKWGFAVRMRDGRVLFGGGDGGNKVVQIFDPDTNAVTTTGSLRQGRSMLTAHTLPDGRVAVIGGSSIAAAGPNAPLDSIELYDPATGAFTDAPYKLTIGRTWHASALVRDGTVLVMGGYTVANSCASSVGTVDRLDPVAGTVTPFDALPGGKTSTEWNAVTLLDGSIVAVGGGACGTSQALPEVYFLAGAPTPK